jgi:hypothetical protein
VALAGLALVVLPGLLVVRAPWTALAPLSLAFWVVSAWWWPFATAGRSGVLAAALAGSFLLALLRLLPKHEVAPPPGLELRPSTPAAERPGLPPPLLRTSASLVVLAAALGLLAPASLWHNAPGARMAFQTTTARLIVWRDGIPATAEPLLPLAPVGAHAPAVATLIADLSLVSGLDPGRAAPWVVAAAAALLLVGLFALHATWASPHAAAAGALVGLAASPWPAFLALWGDGEALVALALLLPAAALVVGHASRSSAVAAALLLAAGALAQPVLAAATLFACSAFVLLGAAPAPRRAPRLLAILVLALAFAGPGLMPLARALSFGEAQSAVRSVRAPELLWFAFGVLCASLAPLAFRERGPRPVSSSGRRAQVSLALAAALLLGVRVHGWFGAAQLRDDVRAALARAAERVPPLAAICAGDGVRDFIPALIGRRAGEPGVWVPVAYSEEWAHRDARPCDTALETGMFRR